MKIEAEESSGSETQSPTNHQSHMSSAQANSQCSSGKVPKDASNGEPRPFDFRSTINISEVKPEHYMQHDEVPTSGDTTKKQEPLKKPSNHRRGVSWEKGVTDNFVDNKLPTKRHPTSTTSDDSSSTNILLPRLPDVSTYPSNHTTGSSNGQPHSIKLPPRPPMLKMHSAKKSTFGGKSKSTRNIETGPVNLDTLELEAGELLMELEAETNLIRQFDNEHQKIEPNKNILSGVKDEELSHDFDLSDDDDDDDPHQEKKSSVPSSPTRPMPRPRVMSRELAPNSNPPEPSIRPRTLSRDVSMRPRTVSRDISTGQQPKSHNRQLTMEETLFGLTAALSAVHHAEQEKNDEYLPEEQQIGGRKRADTGGDRLEKAANLFFRRMGRTEVDASGDSTGQSSNRSDDVAITETTPQIKNTTTIHGGESKWDRLRDNVLHHDELSHHKKSDHLHCETHIAGIREEGAEEEVDDIEKGGGDPDTEVTPPKEIDQQANTKSSLDDSVPSKNGRGGSFRGRKKNKQNPFRHLPYGEKIKKDWDQFHDFLRPRKTTMCQYARFILFYIWLPALGVAAILYHIFDNPPTGKGEDADQSQASASWWIIFICIRETFLVCLAKMLQVLIVDYFALHTTASLRLCGPLITLLLVQSKGWPFVVLCWGLLNFALVTGTYPFSNHWLYWQDWWGLFNENNPAGNVTSSREFYVLCTVAVGVGAAVSLKRLVVSVLLGRQTFSNYSQQLAKLMNKMLHISEVSVLGNEIEKRYWQESEQPGYLSDLVPQKRNLSTENFQSLMATADTEDDVGEDITLRSGTAAELDDQNERIVDAEDVDPYTGKLSYSQRARIRELLGQWEEPPRGPAMIDKISISSVLQFRRALAHMDTDYPFSASFGLADTRENCVAAAQAVYERLLLNQNLTEDRYLHFDTIASLAVRKRTGELNKDKAIDLIRTFRPDRDGGISMVDFVKSIDAVYKELRMLRATVAGSSKIDQALEKIFNIFFYVLMATIILSQTGFDVLALFISVSSIVLAFAFMIGSASAKYFEGLLFILVQRPYNIGDRINVSNSESECNLGGAQGWIVENVTLFTTTVILAATMERATISNGTLATSRIINGARSPKPVCYVSMKFSVETPFKRVETFKNAVEKFVKNRPREWIGLLGFRCSRIEADLGFIEYTIVLQHRESWQNIVPVLNSKHIVHCFSLELAKKLNMRFRSPPLPVDLKMVGSTSSSQFDLHYTQESNEKKDNFTKAPESPHHSGRKRSGTDLTTSPHSIGSSDMSLDEIAAMFEGK